MKTGLILVVQWSEAEWAASTLSQAWQVLHGKIIVMHKRAVLCWARDRLRLLRVQYMFMQNRYLLPNTRLIIKGEVDRIEEWPLLRSPMESFPRSLLILIVDFS